MIDRNQMRIAGIVCLVICAVCLFVAVERYQANAGNVRAINAMRQSSPLGRMMGSTQQPSPFGGMMAGPQIKPATPAATKYAILFALLSGVGGGVLLAKSKETSGAARLSRDPRK